ncbi:VOC family protein [Paenibacillus daejeonensis]|uniref:VOC family protein n=1 Tax=Paenibacillus daejeonensis TaxID=135193 RepID=UPI0003813224|nr:VOC family protein [Paenibacillus daejeonensis]
MSQMSRVDVRVTSWDKVSSFYEVLLGSLGYKLQHQTDKWKVFATAGQQGASFFAIMEEPGYKKPKEEIIGFWASSQSEVDRMAEQLALHGGRITEGPRSFPISPTYYGFYFEDAYGNKYELAYRLP